MTGVIHSGTQLAPEPLDTLCVWEGLCDIVGSSFPNPIKDVLLPKLSHSRLFGTAWSVAHQAPLSMDSPGKNTRVFCHFLLQWIFPTQGWNPRLLCWQADSLLSDPPGKPPQRTPEAKNGTDFHPVIHGTSYEGPIWVMPVMADSVTLCVDVVNNRCKVAQVENFYLFFLNHFILSTSIESKRCMCLFCGYVGKVTGSIWKLLSYSIR